MGVGRGGGGASFRGSMFTWWFGSGGRAPAVPHMHLEERMERLPSPLVDSTACPARTRNTLASANIVLELP